MNLMAWLANSAAASEELDTRDVHTVHSCAIIGQQSCQGAAVDLAAIDDGDGLAKKTVAVLKDRVIDLQMLQGFDNGQRCAGENGLLCVVRRIKKANVVVHVEEMGVAEALYVFVQGDSLLDVAVLLLVVPPDRVVHKDAVHIIIIVGSYNGLFEVLLIDLAEVKVEAARTNIQRQAYYR